MVFPIQMVLSFVVQQIVDLPLQNVIDFIKSVYLEMLLYCRIPTVTYNSNLVDLIVLWKSGELGPLLLQSFIIQQSSSFLV